MSFPPRDFEERAPSQNDSLTLSATSDESPALQPSVTLPSHTNTMDRRQGRVFSQSTPTLQSTSDGADNNTEASSDGPDVHPARYHSHGAIASHFLAQSPDAYGGQTWVDFLRESGAEQPAPRSHNRAQSGEIYPESGVSSRFTLPRPQQSSEASSRTSIRTSRSSDRKRRLTAGGSPTRRTSSIMRIDQVGSSSSDPILLGSSPPAHPGLPRPTLPLHPSRSSFASTPRRESDIVLPPWQPDSDVTHCPVCGSQFTFFYRKHHCRKCGRVVCSACSPHRITIPRQFIVHPPSESPTGISIMQLTESNGDEVHEDSPTGLNGNPALGGGQEVRVCNPCVPDPNNNPPPLYRTGGYHLAPGHQYGSLNASAFMARESTSQPPSGRDEHRHGGVHLASGQQYGSQNASAFLSQELPVQPPSGTDQYRPGGYHLAPGQQYNSGRFFNPSGQMQGHLPNNPMDNVDRNHYPAPHGLALPRTNNLEWNAGMTRDRRTAVDPNVSHHQRLSAAINDRSHPSFNMHPNFMDSHGPRQAVAAPPRAAPPRRQIAEEDECPVCGEELPAMGPANDDSARVQHITDCIAAHSSTPPVAPPSTQSQTSTSLPAQRTRGMSSAGAGEASASSNRHSLSLRGLFPYTATEKDCLEEDGSPAECIICFEEFAAGDRLARLVCWCKFHETCIKQWWETKGRGNCPTHALHN